MQRSLLPSSGLATLPAEFINTHNSLYTYLLYRCSVITRWQLRHMSALQPGTVYLLRYEPPNCRWAPSSACWRLSFSSMREPSSSAVVTEQRVRHRIKISGLNSTQTHTDFTFNQLSCRCGQEHTINQSQQVSTNRITRHSTFTPWAGCNLLWNLFASFLKTVIILSLHLWHQWCVPTFVFDTSYQLHTNKFCNQHTNELGNLWRQTINCQGLSSFKDPEVAFSMTNSQRKIAAWTVLQQYLISVSVITGQFFYFWLIKTKHDNY